MPIRVVRPGDTLARLAFREGSTAPEAWAHPKNAWLTDAGRSPDQLGTGDTLHLDARPHPPPASLSVGSENRFVVEVPRVRHEIALSEGLAPDAAATDPTSEGGPRRRERSPVAGKSFFVTGDGELVKGSSDDDGVCVFELRVTTYRATLEIPELSLKLGLLFGHLEPVVTLLGVQQRLSHLRFYTGPLDGVASPRLEAAIRAFQESEPELGANGVLDDATQRALVRRHGS
jgi:N-acetylmuramoyl-L-alanine amidase